MLLLRKMRNNERVECDMVIMDIKATNFYNFNNFHMNMSYPKKIVNSIIESEYLKDRPKFRYKKLNVIMASNASGKTTLGLLLLNAINFMARKESIHLTEMIDDFSKLAVLEMDFVVQDILYRVKVLIEPIIVGETCDLKIALNSCTINKSDSYEMCVKKIEKQEVEYSNEYTKVLEKLENCLEWFFIFTKSNIITKIQNPNKSYEDILNKVLKTLDPSIKSVTKLVDVDNAYKIMKDNAQIIIQDGELITDKLSTGTLKGVKIVNILYSILNKDHQFYYCDEMFSYIHSDIEKAILAIMVEALAPNTQLFYTTHNWDILELGYPKHSYGFLKKEKTQEGYSCVYKNASQYLQRNTDSLRRAVENDMFGIAPELTLLDELL